MCVERRRTLEALRVFIDIEGLREYRSIAAMVQDKIARNAGDKLKLSALVIHNGRREYVYCCRIKTSLTTSGNKTELILRFSRASGQWTENMSEDEFIEPEEEFDLARKEERTENTREQESAREHRPAQAPSTSYDRKLNFVKTN